VFNQDYSVWVGQGPIARRDLERLGESDRGIILFRQLLEQEMESVARGDDPMNTFRDPVTNACLEPPLEHIKFGATQRPPRYMPGEAGYSEAAAEIEHVQATWDSVLAAAR